jgi:hypothetical protein
MGAQVSLRHSIPPSRTPSGFSDFWINSTRTTMVLSPGRRVLSVRASLVICRRCSVPDASWSMGVQGICQYVHHVAGVAENILRCSNGNTMWSERRITGSACLFCIQGRRLGFPMAWRNV